MVKLILAIFLALASARETFAMVDVTVQGSGAAGPSYSGYSTSGAATVAGATSASEFGINASFGSKASIGVLKAYGHIDSPKGSNNYFFLVAGGFAEYHDTLHVTGSAPTTLHFAAPTTGSTEPNSVDASALGNLTVSTAHY